MNRAQRRQAERDKAKRKERTCLVPQDIAFKLPTGTRFTVAGLRLTKRGTLITDCAPGRETVFTSETDQVVSDLDKAAQFLDAQDVDPRNRKLWDGQKMHGGLA